MGKKTKVALTVGAASVAAWAASKVASKQQPRADKKALQFSDIAILTNTRLSQKAEVHPLSSLLEAADLGVHGFAVDIQLTKDEEILLVPSEEFLFSDEISNYTLEEIQLNFNSTTENSLQRTGAIVSLRELLDSFPQLLLIVSMSDSPTTYEGSLIPSKLWRLLKEMDATEQVVVTSPYDEQIDRFNLYAQNSVALGAGNEEIKKAYVAYTSKFGHLYLPNADLFCLPEKLGVFPLASEGFINFLHELNIKVFYESNETNELEKLSKLGADGFITTQPEQLLTFLHHD